MPTDEEIGRILRECKTVAVVGCSPRPDRDSHEVAAYLKAAGYRVIPVNPNETEILGERCYPTVDAIPESVDLVDVFRRSEDVPAVADAALRKGVRAFWMQLGIRHADAAARLRAAGVDVVEDLCTKVEHARRG
jgi:predicted CoA-binding protein